MKPENNSVYLSFGRHGRRGLVTSIDVASQLESFIGGRFLLNALPKCEAVYHSPIARAVETAKFRALGLQSRLIERNELTEDVNTFTVRRFINAIVQNTAEPIRHYHFVTHLPVLSKLGLPELDTCEMCVCKAANWEEMLADNYTIERVPPLPPEAMPNLLHQLHINSPERLKACQDRLYNMLRTI